MEQGARKAKVFTACERRDVAQDTSSSQKEIGLISSCSFSIPTSSSWAQNSPLHLAEEARGTGKAPFCVQHSWVSTPVPLVASFLISLSFSSVKSMDLFVYLFSDHLNAHERAGSICRVAIF